MSQNAKVITCGCRFNRYESAEIRARLENAPGAGTRPMVVINTCAVTSRSEAKSRYAIRRAIHENPGASIVVAGCLAELEPAAMRAIDGVHLVLGNEEKLAPAHAGTENVRTGAVQTVRSFNGAGPALMENRTAAYLKIQNGCDETCSFCVVRLVRGRGRSATPDYVRKNMARLIARGAKEIVLTGINVGTYGADNGTNLAALLRGLAGRGEVRLRLSSINPLDVTDELLDLIAHSPHICKHLHIPLQSGSDAVLAAMRRPYTAQRYRAMAERAAEKIPAIAIGCDVMAGFPGETEKDFNDTARLLETLPLSYAHVFSYSHRARTMAASLPGAIAPAVIKERSNALKEIAARKNLDYRKSLVGSAAEVLVERKKSKAGLLTGKTGTFVPVEFSGGEFLREQLAKVRLEGVSACGMTGTAA